MAGASAARILISYRRDDVPHAADRIADRLSHHFGPDAVFVDLRAIETGVNWRTALSSALDACDALLVLIGPRWPRLDELTGVSALHRADDPVRLEIRTALERGIAVIPVVVDDGRLPSAESLPDDCTRLTDFQAHSVTREHFDHDVLTLIDGIESRAGITASAGRRAGAFTIDVLPFAFVFFHRGWTELAVPTAILYVLYHWIPVAVTGQTLGKLLMGIRVEFLDRSLSRWLLALFRPLTGYALSVFSFVGLIQFALHRRHSTFHDVLFRTRVLRERGGPVPLLLRGLDQVSRGFDGWVQRLLGRSGAVGRLISYLVTAHFGLVWLLRGLRSLVSRLRGEERRSKEGAGPARSPAAPSGAKVGAVGAPATAAGAKSAAGLVQAVAVPALTSLVLAGASLGVYESVVPDRVSIIGRILELGVLDLSGAWRFTEVEVVNNGVYRPPALDDSVLVFDPIGRGRFRVRRGPDFLLGSVMRPRLSEGEDVLAVDTLRYRADCIDSDDGSRVAPDAYAAVVTWSFARLADPPTEPADGGAAEDRIRFHYRLGAVLDSEAPEAESCRDRASLDVDAVVRRLTDGT